ncbi:DUF1134 domain-containing protein [Sphingomonas sp. GlSt437]|uniref:DUF1134 domain-containing protein n=1 Tax=Sphingomonas sp. GlSt437 TaxID=3389970 RepID=UPI003A8758DD
MGRVRVTSRYGKVLELVAALALAGSGAVPSMAQVKTVDPNQAIDSDLSSGQKPAQPPTSPASAQTAPDNGLGEPIKPDQSAGSASAPAAAAPTAGSPDATRSAESTYSRKDLLSAGEGVFGKGAQGLAGLLEKVLREQGEPNAYIAGREASGAFVLGARYGSGLMSHKVEGDRPIYWTGPSVGFDLGGNASKVFVLVYNLYDTEDIFRRYPEGEGHLYFVGGFSATYLRRGNIVLIPIRLGVGLRAGVNLGYMKFSKKAKWLPL